jgi:WD40 repeat protein
MNINLLQSFQLAALPFLLITGSLISQEPRPPADKQPDAKTDNYGEPLPPKAVLRLGSSRWRNWNDVPFAFSPDSKTIAVRAGDNGIGLYDLATGKEQSQVKNITFPRRILFTSAGRQLLIQGMGRGMGLVNLASGKHGPIFDPPTEHELTLVRTSPDGMLAAFVTGPFGKEKDVTIWDVTMGKVVSTFKRDRTIVKALAFTHDSKTLAVVGTDAIIRFWDPASGKEGPQLPQLAAANDWLLAYSPDGQTLMSTSDKNVVRWDLTPRANNRTFKVPHKPAAISDDARLLALADNQRFVLWDAVEQKELCTLRFEASLSRNAAFSPDNRYFAAVTSPGDLVQLWDVATGKELHARGGHRGRVTSLAFLPDGKSLVAASLDGTIRQWDLTDGKELRSFRTSSGDTDHVACSADGKIVAGRSLSGVIWWDGKTGEVLNRVPPANSRIYLASWALAPDGKTVATYDDNTIRLWNTANGKPLQKFRDEGVVGKTMTFTPDGKGLLFRGQDSQIHLHEVATGKKVRSFKGETFALSMDGKVLAAEAGGTVHLWELASGKEQGRLTIQDTIDSLAWSPDGKLLAVGQYQIVAVHNVATGKEVERFTGHVGYDKVLAFSPDGQRLAAGAADATILIWEFNQKAAPVVLPKVDEAALVKRLEARKAKITRDAKAPDKPIINVYLAYTDCTDGDLQGLATLQHLRFLSISDTRVTDAGLKELAGLQRLESLDLARIKITDEGVKELDGLKNLQSLILTGTGVTDAGLKHLAGLTNLRTLTLMQTDVSDKGLAHLAGLRNLQSLLLSSTKVTDAGMKELAGLTGLQSLFLGSTRITDAGLKKLARLKELRSLDLNRTKVTDAGLKVVGDLANLTWLVLSGVEISDTGLKELTRLKKLRTLHLSGDQGSAQGVEMLRKALPGCDVRVTPARPKTGTP